MDQPRDWRGRWMREDKVCRVYARCTQEQFDTIMRRARDRDQTVSGYLLGAVDRDVLDDPRTVDVIAAIRGRA